MIEEEEDFIYDFYTFFPYQTGLKYPIAIGCIPDRNNGFYIKVKDAIFDKTEVIFNSSLTHNEIGLYRNWIHRHLELIDFIKTNKDDFALIIEKVENGLKYDK